MIATEDCVQLAVKSFEVYVHGSEERLTQAASGDKLDGSEAVCVMRKAKKRTARLGEESFTWPVFETN